MISLNFFRRRNVCSMTGGEKTNSIMIPSPASRTRERVLLSFALALLGTSLRAQDTDASLGSSTGWERYDWLKAGDSSTEPTGGQLTATTSQDLGTDPFAVVTNGSIWQEKYGATYIQPVTGALAFSYESDAVTLNQDGTGSTTPTDGTPGDLSHAQKAAMQFQPLPQVKLTGNVHDMDDEMGPPNAAMNTRGTGVTAETQLPLNSTLTLGASSDDTATGQVGVVTTSDNSYDAQIKQPLGKLPLTAVFKSHYEETTSEGTVQTRLPSIEQSLVWETGG